MLVAARDFPGQYPTLASEAGFGLRWIGRLWDPVRKVMYVQVGIGNGNASNTIEGDYNFWFLPQREDKLGARPGAPSLGTDSKEMLPKRVLLWKLESLADPLSLDDSLSHSFIS